MPISRVYAKLQVIALAEFADIVDNFGGAESGRETAGNGGRRQGTLAALRSTESAVTNSIFSNGE